MAKQIYFTLLLLVVSLIYEAYGNHHIVRHKRLPSHKTYSNNGSWDSSSSPSTAAEEANGAVADAAPTPGPARTSSFPSSPLSKLSSLRDSIGYKNHGLGLNSNPLGSKYFGQQPNNMGSNDNIENMQNSISSRLPNKNLSGLHNRNNQMFMPSENLNTLTRQNSIIPSLLNDKLQKGLYYRNNYNDKTLEDRNIGKRQNSITSDFQDFPSSKKTNDPLPRRLMRQNTSSSSNNDDSQRNSDGNNDLNMMNLMNFFNKPSRNSGINNEKKFMKFASFRRCCINDDCRMLQDGEECSVDEYFKNKQQPNNPMSTTPNNGYDVLSDMISNNRIKFLGKNVKSFGQNSSNSWKSDMGNFQEMGRLENNPMDSMRYSTINPSVGSNSGMGPYMAMPQKKTPKNYPYSKPINVSEDEVNKIRNQVLQRSNFYREKYNLEPFTLDDQLNNCAQDWANEMARSNMFDHREDNAYGENLFKSQDSNNLGKEAVDNWYNEITMFNVDGDESDLSSNYDTFHMTQLLWKSSTKLGVGISQNSDGMYNVVANYDPVGNMIGTFKENLPEIKQEDVDEVM